MLLQVVASVVIGLLTIWLLWFEFGWGLIAEPIFRVLVAWWFYISFMLFLLRWGEVKKKSETEVMIDKFKELEEKISELINEIRQDRNERKNKSKQ